MAEVAVKLFLPKLFQLIEKEVDLLAGVRDDVSLLRNRLQWLQLFLKDADEKSNKDKRIKFWVTQIRDAAIDAEDIIDEYLLQIEQHYHHKKRRLLSFLGRPTEKSKQWMGHHDMGQKIKNINARLDHIKANASEYRITPGAEGQGSCSSRENRRRPFIEESDGLVGIDKDADKVAKLLVEGETRRSVVSIFGMGGLGKTTLARYVYNCEEVKRHFQCFAWITVSQEFRVHDLLCHAINCITGTEMGELRPKDEKDLREKLLQCLKGKVYLVVLDDMWEIDAWNGLVTSFPNEANGSRILITTRNKDLALQVDPLIGLYELRFLTEEECWELLCKKALPKDPHECPPHLKEEGKKIVEKCKGLPLAVVVLGGLLSRKQQTLHEWRKVLESIGWQLSQSDHQISSILALSYNDLPYHLKPCFLHFTSFPEDEKVLKDELIRMWVAEGFIEERGLETLEDIAEDYLLDLTDRSMIQLAERDMNDNERFSMHDLLRDIGMGKAKEERFLDVYVNAHSVAPTTARRLAITYDDISKCISINHSHRYLRSLYCFSSHALEKVEWKNIHLRFKFLRVMHIHCVKEMGLPDEIRDLIHLRYICIYLHDYFSKDRIIRLPSTFNMLYNLQTLRVIDFSGRPIHIHDDIWKMKELRHLDLVDWISFLPKNAKPLQLSKLTNLQTLRMVYAGDWIKDDLGKMTSLRRLGILGVKISDQDVVFESIGRLKNLRCLHLGFNEFEGKVIVPIHLSLVHLEELSLRGQMDALPPFQDFGANLTNLTLEYCMLRQDPMAILEKLPKLRFLLLRLHCYIGEKMSFNEQGFPELRVLRIYDMNLKECTVEEGAMPKLREFHIMRCKSLKMIPEGFQHLTSLKKLRLAMPNKFYLRIQEDGEDWFKIKHIPLIERCRYP